ncbi:MAG: signal peptidase I [Oscillospiraceae bacterium]|nr:signal peptidase I [Oscillospiraceae bacterium]
MKTTMLRRCFQRIKGLPAFLKIGILAAATALVLNSFVFQVSLVRGKSMEPLVMENAVVIGLRPAPALFGIARGDVVIFKKKSVFEGELIKQVVGLPGDGVEIKDHILYCSGKEVLRDDSLADLPYCIVPENSYFVLGVNLPGSSDSRHWEDRFVRLDEIESKVIM